MTGDGLVLTNHHCVRDCAQSLSTPTDDYVKDGFAAARRDDEKLCPGMQAEILDGDRRRDRAREHGRRPARPGSDFVKARDAAIAAIEKEGCAGRETQYRCQVITLYQGGQYKLYTYRKYSDVRLVFAPELRPRSSAAIPTISTSRATTSISRSCGSTRTASGRSTSRDHLRWSAAPPKDGEPVFVVGNPGSTQRLLTADQLETVRDLSLPETLIMLSELRGRLIRFSEESAEHARIADDTLFGIENTLKAYRGECKALVEPGFVAAKRASRREAQSGRRCRPEARGGDRRSVGGDRGRAAATAGRCT